MRVTKKMLEDQLQEAQKKNDQFRNLLQDQLGLCTQEEEKHRVAMNMNKGGVNLLKYMIEQFDAPLPKEEDGPIPDND